MSEPHNVRRLPALIVLVVALVAFGLADRAKRPPLTPPDARLVTAYAPTASPPDALTSTWYCPAATAVPGGVADSTVVVFNPTARELRGTLQVIGVSGNNATKAITVPARGRLATALSDMLHDTYVGAVVRLGGGGAIVEHTSTGPVGDAFDACASSASTRWFIPEGATTKSASLIYALFNPFPDDAIVDLSFATEQGRDAPAAFQGVVVPANGLVALDIGTHVRRRAHVSAAIYARRGRIVVEALQVQNGDGRRGVGLMLGAPRAATSFVFPDGIAGATNDETLHFFNPSANEAVVQLDLVLDSGQAQPFELRVPANDRYTIDLGSESRVPKDVGHALLVHVSNNVGIAVQRTTDYGPPNARRGYISDIGATGAALHWGFAAGGQSATQDEWIAVLNEAPTAVTVNLTKPSIDSLLTLPGLARVRIPRGGRTLIHMADHGGTADTPLIVNASGPVVVERTMYRNGGTGASSSAGVIMSTANG